MKKALLTLAVILSLGTTAKACIAANARTEYMTIFGTISAIDNSSFNFANNTIGGKATLGVGTFKDYFTFAGTFEMYGKGWGNELVTNAKDWRLGGQIGFDPFASIDRESAVRFRILAEVGTLNADYLCSAYGARLGFGRGNVNFFIQDMAGFDYINKSCKWSNHAEIGLQFKFEVGKGKVFCNSRK